MTFLSAVAVGILAYTFVALLLLRFMRFLTSCDREIRFMTKGRHHGGPAMFKSPKKAKRILRLRALSA